MSTASRKEDHLRIPVEKNVVAAENPWEKIHLRHEALPEFDYADVQLDTTFLGHDLAAPILVTGMTGGTPLAGKINARLAAEAGRRGWAMGVGSQRAAIEDPSLGESFQCSDAPFRLANLGLPQLIAWDNAAEKAQAAIDMIDAHGLCIHLNYLQESIQPEGDTNAAGGLETIAALCEALDVPVIAKETGAGIDAFTAQRLESAGVAAIDVGGLGGTSFSAVEHYRAADAGDAVKAELGELFWNWGNPTPECIQDIRQISDIPLIATGGLTSGLDAGKAIALGANMAGFAGHLFRAAMESPEKLTHTCDVLLEALKTTLFLSGVQRPDFFREDPHES